eukprot:gene10465-22480_t
MSATAAKLSRVASAACTMAGANIPPSDTIKILGVVVDQQLGWEAHAAAAVRRSRNATYARYGRERYRAPKAAERSVRALRKLPWTTWERRRAAMQAAAVSKIWHHGEPRVLSSRLRLRPEQQVMQRRVAVPIARARLQFREKMFGRWAPRVLTRVLRGEVLQGLPD